MMCVRGKAAGGKCKMQERQRKRDECKRCVQNGAKCQTEREKNVCVNACGLQTICYDERVLSIFMMLDETAKGR